MADPLLHVGAIGRCPHPVGLLQISPASQRVKVSGQPVATLADQFVIGGCTFAPSNLSPCVRVLFSKPAGRVKASGQPVLLKTSIGRCQNPAQAPQGNVQVSATQTRVKGT